MSKLMASLLVFIDTVGVAIALLGGNMMLCLLMGIMTIVLYVKVNPILFGDYDRRRRQRIEQRRKALTARQENNK